MVDDKFIDGFIEDAEAVSPNKNQYIFTFNPPATYVTSTKGIYAPYGSAELKDIINTITVTDRVYVHWFNENVMQVVDEIDSKIPIYLFFWGGDFIEQSKDFYNFNFDPITKRHIKINELLKMFKSSINPLTYARLIRNYFLKKTKVRVSDCEFSIRKRFLKRLNYFCHWNRLDFKVVCKAYECAPMFMNFFYTGTYEKSKNDVPSKLSKSNATIWLGNSDTRTNNHLDAIRVLAGYKNNDIKIICPLSYGDAKYGDFITLQGQKVFAEKWSSIRSFMPLPKYLELFSDVDVVVMYHNRTQAAGNTISFIKMGKKVFLKNQSTVYQLMKNNGIVVFDANTIKNMTFEEFSRPLTEEQIQSNVEKISDLFSEKRRLEYLNRLLN